MADQICYAVLCVFSYFAAGQEQKKAILEQAARVPPAAADTLVSNSPVHDDARRRSPLVEKRSPVNRASEVRFSPSKVENAEMKVATELQQSRGGVRESNIAAKTEYEQAPAVNRSPKTQRAPIEEGTPTVERSPGADRAQRSDSLPPRRPPPPVLPPAPHQRLARAHSHAAPTRPPDPPLIPPRIGAVTAGIAQAGVASSVTSSRPTGPPPALPPRQLSAAADIGAIPRVITSPGRGDVSEASGTWRGGANGSGRVEASGLGRGTISGAGRGDASAARRAPPQRQGSMTAPFSSSNPFTSPRHAEFVIPQRNNVRRSSTTDRS